MPRPRILLFILVLILVRPSVAQADRTDDFIRSELKRQNIPGLSLAVIKDGEIIKAAGYGVANLKLNTSRYTRNSLQNHFSK
jgi:CubicO group peptidase (beta-lactamase class C family)